MLELGDASPSASWMGVRVRQTLRQPTTAALFTPTQPPL